MKGFSTAQKLDKFGMRGSNTCEVSSSILSFIATTDHILLPISVLYLLIILILATST